MTGCLEERTGGKIRTEIDVLYTGVYVRAGLKKQPFINFISKQ